MSLFACGNGHPSFLPGGPCRSCNVKRILLTIGGIALLIVGTAGFVFTFIVNQ